MLLFALFIGCKNSATLPERIGDVLEGESQSKRYAVGKGGGFTGVYEEYILNENGKVFKRDFNYDREVFIKQLPPLDVSYFLEQIESLGIEGESINEPGNMNYYIEIREGPFSINKILWGSNTYHPPNKFVSFHKEMFDKLKE